VCSSAAGRPCLRLCTWLCRRCCRPPLCAGRRPGKAAQRLRHSHSRRKADRSRLPHIPFDRDAIAYSFRHREHAHDVAIAHCDIARSAAGESDRRNVESHAITSAKSALGRRLDSLYLNAARRRGCRKSAGESNCIRECLACLELVRRGTNHLADDPHVLAAHLSSTSANRAIFLRASSRHSRAGAVASTMTGVPLSLKHFAA